MKKDFEPVPPPYKYEVQYEGQGLSAHDTFYRPEDVIEAVGQELEDGADDSTIIIKKKTNS